MEFKWLEDFLSLVESGSFSRRIRALEAWLSVALVDRSTYPTRLTDAGEAFKGPAADLLSRLHAARVQARGSQAIRGDALVFAVPHTLAFAFFPGWLGQLKADFGEVPTRLVAGNVHDVAMTLVEGGCDLLLCYHHPSHPVWLDPARFEGLTLGGEQVRPVCRATRVRSGRGSSWSRSSTTVQRSLGAPLRPERVQRFPLRVAAPGGVLRPARGPDHTRVSHSAWRSPSLPSSRTQAKKRRCSSRVSGPGAPSPTRRRSTSTTGVISAAVPVKNTSSAT